MQNLVDARNPSPLDVSRFACIENTIAKIEPEMADLRSKVLSMGAEGTGSAGTGAKSLSKDIGAISKLGDGGVAYDEWTKLLHATIDEVRPNFVGALEEARALGPNKLTGPKMAHNSPPGLEQFSKQLFTVLLRNTSG